MSRCHQKCLSLLASLPFPFAVKRERTSIYTTRSGTLLSRSFAIWNICYLDYLLSS